MKIAACYCVFNEEDMIQYSIRSVIDFVDIVLVSINESSWSNKFFPKDKTEEKIIELKNNKIKIIKTNNATAERHQRNTLLEICKQMGIDYYFLIDADEIYEKRHMENIIKLIKKNPKIDLFNVDSNSYWRSCYYMASNINIHYEAFYKVSSTKEFCFRDGYPAKELNTIIIPRKIGYMHHYVWARPSEKIKMKIETNSDGVVRGVPINWFNETFMKWTPGCNMVNVHPYWPLNFPKIIKNDYLPEPMKDHPYSKMEIIP